MRRTPISNTLLLWSLALLAAGISGNLIDRFRLGRVIDFILIYYKSYQWPVFNIADACVVVGVLILAYHLLLVQGQMPMSNQQSTVSNQHRPDPP